MRRTLILVVALSACGPPSSGAGTTSGDEARDVAANQNAPAPTPYVAPGEQTAGGATAPGTPSGTGASLESAVGVCGPIESYRFVSQYRCPDGSQPLGGDPAAGQRSRVGNVGANATGHIIDLYRVPCASGAVDVFVDMYGCDEMSGVLGQP